MADPESLQYQVRQNSEELQDFLKDLYKWEKDVQAKDKLLSSSGSGSDSTHPIRNKPQKKKSKPKPQKQSAQAKPKIKGFDFQAWDKYDVDEALRDIDEEEEMKTQSTSDEDEDTDDEYAEQRRLQHALFEKEKGNDLFKEGKYEAAINRYTTAIGLDPYNAILPANRAMALIKVERYGAAIQDCDTALSLDNTYIKAYARRASAKQALGRLQEAMEDYERVAELQPGNKQATEEIGIIKKMLAKKTKTVPANIDKQELSKPNCEPVKKPMKRYIIEEIGTASSDEEDALCEKTEKLKTNIEDVTNEQLLIAKEEERTEKIKTVIDVPTTEKSKTPPEDKTALDTENKTMNISGKEAEEERNFRSVKTTAENTAYLKTNEARERSCEQAVGVQSLSQCSAIQSSIDLTPPVSSVQFETTWKRLERQPDLLYKYMKGIQPERLPNVMGESVESTMLMKILSLLRDFYVRDRLPIFTELKCIAEVRRFSMVLMFLSTEEKKVIKDLFNYLCETPDDERNFTKEELRNLMLKYGLR